MNRGPLNEIDINAYIQSRTSDSETDTVASMRRRRLFTNVSPDVGRRPVPAFPTKNVENVQTNAGEAVYTPQVVISENQSSPIVSSFPAATDYTLTPLTPVPQLPPTDTQNTSNFNQQVLANQRKLIELVQSLHIKVDTFINRHQLNDEERNELSNDSSKLPLPSQEALSMELEDEKSKTRLIKLFALKLEGIPSKKVTMEEFVYPTTLILVGFGKEDNVCLFNNVYVSKLTAKFKVVNGKSRRKGDIEEISGDLLQFIHKVLVKRYLNDPETKDKVNLMSVSQIVDESVSKIRKKVNDSMRYVSNK